MPSHSKTGPLLGRPPARGRVFGAIGLLVLSCSLNACRAGITVTQDADGATPQDAVRPEDSATSTDSSVRPDGSPDAEVGSDSSTPDSSTPDSSTPDSSTPVDVDGDGYPADRDCNDFDRAVYPGVTRSCATACDSGTQTCGEDGEWSPCSATADCACATPGETRLLPCGNCGVAEQVCGASYLWSLPGPCALEGPCSPGQQTQVTCQYCGTGIVECQPDCHWGPDDCSGECTPGETETTSTGCSELWQRQQRECDSSCAWSVAEPCTGQCLTAARQGSSDFKDEICIPGGPFIMGSAEGVGDADERPARTVTLSPYFIDKYEVTYGRYLECVNAGVCAAATVPITYVLPEAASRPIVGVNLPMAVTFCHWDGGRVLPTEAQWEKAARGQAPRTVLNPWGDEVGTCELCGGYECIPVGWYGAWPVDQHPLDASYYGVVGMAGNVRELCSDWYDPSYYSYGDSHDPTGPSTGQDLVRRGYDFAAHLYAITRGTTNRSSDGPFVFAPYVGFRCARAGW